MQVDAVSLFICVVIYLHLGFSNSHAHALRVPITFGVTLSVMLCMVYAVLYMQDRWALTLAGLSRDRHVSFTIAHCGMHQLHRSMPQLHHSMRQLYCSFTVACMSFTVALP